MKIVTALFLLLLSVNLSAQNAEKAAVQNTIVKFFEGFHQQDSTLLKKTVSDAVVMRRISIDSVGNASLSEQEFPDFLNSILSIPKTLKYKEVIKSYSIHIDGPMAQVWTPYEFIRNGELSHCGVNSFQLFKEDTDWKIIYIIDTGRKEGCE